MLSINLNSPDLQRELTRIPKLLADTTPLLAAGGRQLANDLQDHFQARNAEPNKMGWPKKNFWNGIRSATALSSVTSSESIVTISDPAINQKVYGGTITPKRGRMLAIPMNAQAYAAGSPRALNTNFLHILVSRAGQVFLVENEATNVTRRRSKKGGYKPVSQMGGRFWYHLVPSVTQDPDPRALPDEDYLYGSVLFAIRNVLDAQIDRLS